MGVGQFLENPALELHAKGQVLAGNDDWGSATRSPLIASATALTGAFELADGSRDAALLVQLAPGEYTVHVSGADGGTGIAIVEVYDVPDVPL
jgi:hypothetical protein